MIVEKSFPLEVFLRLSVQGTQAMMRKWPYKNILVPGRCAEAVATAGNTWTEDGGVSTLAGKRPKPSHQEKDPNSQQTWTC